METVLLLLFLLLIISFTTCCMCFADGKNREIEQKNVKIILYFYATILENQKNFDLYPSLGLFLQVSPFYFEPNLKCDPKCTPIFSIVLDPVPGVVIHNIRPTPYLFTSSKDIKIHQRPSKKKCVKYYMICKTHCSWGLILE